MGKVGVPVVHVLGGGSRGSLPGDHRKPGAVTKENCHDESAPDAHGLRVDDCVAIHCGDGGVDGVTSHQHDVPENKKIFCDYKRSKEANLLCVCAYFPIPAQGMESTETAA